MQVFYDRMVECFVFKKGGWYKMISYYKTVNGRISGIEEYEEGYWINCIAPTDSEVNFLISEFNIEPELMMASLDEEESSHIDYEDRVTLIMIDSPVMEKSGTNLTYYTMPLSIMITEKNVITISLRKNSIIEEFASGIIRNVRTHHKTHFVLYIMLRLASKYLQYLKQIDKITNQVEQELKKSMKNKELIQLLEVEKSLVYFSSSLKATKVTLEKILRGRFVKLYEEDQELLDDVLIEIKQAVEMSDIYLNILSGTMDAFASIISNNLNIVMKILASITLILSIPTIVSGVYGMNTPNFPLMDYWWAPIVISGIFMVISYIALHKKDMI